jgi:hypothetical protein
VKPSQKTEASESSSRKLGHQWSSDRVLAAFRDIERDILPRQDPQAMEETVPASAAAGGRYRI